MSMYIKAAKKCGKALGCAPLTPHNSYATTRWEGRVCRLLGRMVHRLTSVTEFTIHRGILCVWQKWRSEGCRKWESSAKSYRKNWEEKDRFETNWGSFHWPRPTGEKAKAEKYSHEILHRSRSKNTAMYGRKATTVLSECRAAALACYKRLIINVSLLLFSQSSSTCALFEKELLGSTSGMGMFYFCLQEGFPLLVPV